MKTYCAVIILSLVLISASGAQISVTFDSDVTNIWDMNIQRSCVTTGFEITSRISQDTLYIVERDSMPLATCGACYYTLCTSFAGLSPGTYHAVVMHQFAVTLTTDTLTTAGSITFTISTHPSISPGTTYNQSGCNSSPQSVTDDGSIPQTLRCPFELSQSI